MAWLGKSQRCQRFLFLRKVSALAKSPSCNSAGLDLQFVLRLELGEDQEVPEEKLAKLNEALGKACPRLKFGDK